MDHGMLRDSGDVKILLLYILRDLPAPVPPQTVTDIVSDMRAATYFDASDAVAGILETGHAARDGDGMAITPLGLETVELLEKNIPFSLRQKAQASVLRAVQGMRERSELICSLEERGDGFVVELGARDGDDELFRLRLLVYNRMQAEAVMKKFRGDPSALYTAIINELSQ